MDFYKQRANELSTVQSSKANEDKGSDELDPDMYFNHVMENGSLDSVMRILFSPCSFTYSVGGDGLVRSFIVLDELGKGQLFNMEIQNYNLQHCSLLC